MKWFRTNPHRILLTNGQRTGLILGQSPDAAIHKATDEIIRFARGLSSNDPILLKVFASPEEPVRQSPR